MINVAYEFVNTELNKDQRGKISPSDFNTVARAAIANVTDNLLEKLRQVAYRELRGGHGANLASQTEFSEQIVEYYLKSIQIRTRYKDVFKIPDDCRSIASLSLSNGTEIEKVTKPEFHRLVNTKSGKPTSCYPVYYKLGIGLHTFPLQNEVFITYVRTPKVPKWTYREVMGQPIFDNTKSDFQDLDIPYELFPAFMREALKLCGISIREVDVAQVVMNEQQIDSQEER